MELYLLHHEEWNQLYNCTMYSVNDVPLERRQHTILGIVFIAMFFIFEIGYLPCLCSIWRHLDQSSCYKFMFFIGIVDILGLCLVALIQGYFGLIGAVFCTYPDAIYFMGIFGFALWVLESTSECILALNRCVEIVSPYWGEALFRGNRSWCWLILPLFYTLLISIKQMPILFTGVYFSWFFNPHVGYIDDFGATYYSNWQIFHNYLVVFCLTSSYIAFTVIFFCKTARSGGASQTTLAQKATFLQVLAISALNAMAGVLYIYMQFFRISDWIIVASAFNWVGIHGLPVLIYLCMNKTIRRDVAQMVFRRARMGGSTAIVPSQLIPSNIGTSTVKTAASRTVN